MRIEIEIKDWQNTWNWCNINLLSSDWDMIYSETKVVFSIDEQHFEDFNERK